MTIFAIKKQMREKLDEIKFKNYSNAFDHRLAVAILRIAEGLDCSNSSSAVGSADEEHQGVLVQSSYDLAGNTLMHADSDLSMSGHGITRVQSVPTIGKSIIIFGKIFLELLQ